MPTTLERLDAKVTDARRQFERATTKRDGAIVALIKSAAQIKQAQRALARVEKRRSEARTAERAAKRKPAGPAPGDAPAPLAL